MIFCVWITLEHYKNLQGVCKTMYEVCGKGKIVQKKLFFEAEMPCCV